MTTLFCYRVPQKSAAVAIFNTSPCRWCTLSIRAYAAPAAQVERTSHRLRPGVEKWHSVMANGMSQPARFSRMRRIFASRVRHASINCDHVRSGSITSVPGPGISDGSPSARPATAVPTPAPTVCATKRHRESRCCFIVSPQLATGRSHRPAYRRERARTSLRQWRKEASSGGRGPDTDSPSINKPITKKSGAVQLILILILILLLILILILLLILILILLLLLIDMTCHDARRFSMIHGSGISHLRLPHLRCVPHQQRPEEE